MKYLLLVAVLYVLWRVWKKRQDGSLKPPPAASPPVERMVLCAYCSVHLPESDAVKDGSRFYCSEAHRQAAASAGK
ncbi:MAG: PP0621 family protein [Azonexus sp.]